MLLTPIAPLAIYQHFYTHLDYDPFNDFVPVSELGTFDFGIAVGPQTDAKTLKDLVDWAKANPSEANYAIPGAGTLPHFLGVMFGRAAKIDLRPVPYHGSAAGLTDLVAGHIPIEITTTSDLVQMAEAGRIRVLATSNRQRSPFLPNVPTLREAGYDLVASGWYGMFAPAKTPPDVDRAAQQGDRRRRALARRGTSVPGVRIAADRHICGCVCRHSEGRLGKMGAGC